MDSSLNLGVSCRLVALFKWPLQPDKLYMESSLFRVRASPFVRKNKISTLKDFLLSYLLLETPARAPLQPLLLAPTAVYFCSFSNSGGGDPLHAIKLRCSIISLA